MLYRSEYRQYRQTWPYLYFFIYSYFVKRDSFQSMSKQHIDSYILVVLTCNSSCSIQRFQTMFQQECQPFKMDSQEFLHMDHLRLVGAVKSSHKGGVNFVVIKLLLIFMCISILKWKNRST